MKGKARRLSVLIAGAMLLHFLLFEGGEVLLSHVGKAGVLPLSLLLEAVRVGLPILLIRFGLDRLGIDAFVPVPVVRKRDRVCFGIECIALIFLINRLYSLIFTAQPLPEMNTPADFIFGALLTVAFPAILEEFFMRKLVAGSLASFSPSAGIILSALLFALMHLSAEVFPYAFLCGIVLATAYLKTGSLPLVISVHFASNLLSFVLALIGKGMTPSAFTLLLRILFLAMLALFFVLLPRLISLIRAQLPEEETEGPAVASTDLFTPALLFYFLLAVVFQFLRLR